VCPRAPSIITFESKEDFAISGVALLLHAQAGALLAPPLQAQDASPRERVLCFLSRPGGPILPKPRPKPTHQCFIGSLCHEKAGDSQPDWLCRQRHSQPAPANCWLDCLRQAKGRGDWRLIRTPKPWALLLAQPWEGALLRMKVDRQIAPCGSFNRASWKGLLCP